MKLIATDIGIQEEDEILTIGFIGSDEISYLILSQKIDKIEIDDTTLYIEINDQKFGGYNLIERLSLGTRNLKIKLNKNGIKVLDTVEIEVQFSTDNFNSENLDLALNRIFKDSTKLKIN